MRVLMVELHKEPYEKEIGNDLHSMQDVVGGLIEAIDLDENTVLIDNEEGKLIQLEGNRRIGRDIIAGTFFICGSNEEGEFVSLTDEQVAKYSEKFKEPEHYTPEEVEDAIYIEFYSYGPNEQDEDLEIDER